MGERDAASKDAPSSRRRKRKPPGLRDRLKDAIS
jgi:hypothetical protein